MSEETRLDAVSADPLYRQLLTRLRGAIFSGKYPVNSRLPSEKELCQSFGISRVTVRRALLELTEEGLIVRHQGKGSFVSRPRLERNLGIMKSFTELCENDGRKAGARVLRIHERPAGRMDVAFLKVAEGTPILEIVRVRTADGEPVILEKNHFLTSFSWLAGEDLTGSLYQLLRSRGIAPGKAGHEISLCKAEAEDANALGCQKGDSLLQLNELICDQNGNPLHLSSQHILGERFTFRI